MEDHSGSEEIKVEETIEIEKEEIVEEEENDDHNANEDEVQRVEEGKVEVEPNVHLHYELYGTGPEKVILVMGLGGPAYIWYNNVRYFQII